MLSPEEAGRKIASDEARLDVALGAYNAVWQSWRGLDAHSVDACRRAAMAAALGTICSSEAKDR